MFSPPPIGTLPMNETIKTIIRHVLFIATITIFFAFVALLFGGVDLVMELLFVSPSLAMIPSGKALTVEECIALMEFNTNLARHEREVTPVVLESAETWLRDLVEDASIETLEGSYNDVVGDFVEGDGAYVFSVLHCPVYNWDETDTVEDTDTDDMDVDHYMDRSVALAQGYEWE